MKFYMPDAKFVMMFIVTASIITLAAGALGYGAKVKQYLGIGA